MEAKHKIGDTVRVARNRFLGVDSITIKCIATQKEMLEFEGKDTKDYYAYYPPEKNDHIMYTGFTDCQGHSRTHDAVWVYEDEILEDNEVLINNKLDPACRVWHENLWVGTITNATALNDLLVQLKKKFEAGEDISDYCIEYEFEEDGKLYAQYFTINTEHFTIDNAPEGFYDHINKCMKELRKN